MPSSGADQGESVLFTDALAGRDGTGEPDLPRMVDATFADPMADPRPTARPPGSAGPNGFDGPPPGGLVGLSGPTMPPAAARQTYPPPETRRSVNAQPRPPAVVRRPVAGRPGPFPAPGGTHGAPGSAARPAISALPTAAPPAPFAQPPSGAYLAGQPPLIRNAGHPAAPPQPIRSPAWPATTAPPIRSAARPAVAPPAQLPARGGPYPGPVPPGGRSDAAALMQALRTQARQRRGVSTTSRKASGAWGCLVALLVVLFSTGLVQRIINAVTDLLHHR